MKTLTKTILAVLATGLISCALFSQQAQADPITGTITFGGSVNMNGNANTATMVTGWHGFGGVGNPLVVDADGDFLANGVMPGVSTGTFATPWSFNSGAVANFWSVGGFTFNLTASSIFSQGGGWTYRYWIRLDYRQRLRRHIRDMEFLDSESRRRQSGPILLFGGDWRRA